MQSFQAAENNLRQDYSCPYRLKKIKYVMWAYALFSMIMRQGLHMPTLEGRQQYSLGRHLRSKTHVVCLSAWGPSWDYCCYPSGCQNFTWHLIFGVAVAPFQLASITWSFFRPLTLRIAVSKMGQFKMHMERICPNFCTLTGLCFVPFTAETTNKADNYWR